MNRGWMNYVYHMACTEKLHEDTKENIEVLEKVLLLAQYESLLKDGKPFLKYKIHIYEDNIRIKYISDLLRVSPINSFGSYYVSFYSFVIYKKRVKKYMRLNDNKRDEKVAEITSKLDLDKKYFVFEKYRNKHMRRVARLRMREEGNKLTQKADSGKGRGLNIRQALGLCICLPLLFMSILFTIECFVYEETARLTDLTTSLILSSVFLIPYVIWTLMWMRPTKYEIENEFLED